MSFQQINDLIHVSVDTLRFLNPEYKLDVIPEMEEKASLCLPKNKIYEFIEKEPVILGHIREEEDYNSMLINSATTENKIKIIHQVEKGEFLHKIAIQYNCTLENIVYWNNLPDNTLSPGQKLIIWVDKDLYSHIQQR